MKINQQALKIGDDVTITALNLPGRVDAVMIEASTTSYRVVYWTDASRRSEWLQPWEIKHLQESKDGVPFGLAGCASKSRNRN